MRHGHTSALRGAAIATRGVLLACTVTACHTWQVAPLQQATTAWPEPIRVTLTTGAVIMLDEGRVVGDTLLGRPFYATLDSTARYPLTMVARVESKEIDTGRSWAAVLGVVFGTALVVLTALVATLSGWGSDI